MENAEIFSVIRLFSVFNWGHLQVRSPYLGVH